MPAPAHHAVFVSYAREDLEAARQIAEALRGRGIEVWFDRDELRGGDAWDAKIRRQIRECALFLPVISAHTDARLEGYFRREWKQAVERTHDMADDLPFLVPVVIDRTGDAEARVPDKFRVVQWTRLPGGAAPPAFAERVLALLGGAPASAAASVRTAAEGLPPAAPRRRSRGTIIGLAAAAAVAVLVVFLRPWERRSSRAPAAAPASAPVPSALPAPAAFPGDPDLKRAMKLVTDNDAIPEDYALAEDITKGVLGQRPTDPDALTVMAFIQDAFLYRGFERAPERYALARRYAERAVQLAPDNAYAQGALGIYLYQQQGGDLERAQQVLERAIALDPKEPLFYRFRDDVLFQNPNVSSVAAIASAEKTCALFPHDALCHYELSRHYRDVGRIEDMEHELDRTLAIEPIVNAIVWKSRVALWVRGDPEEMKKILDRVPGRGRSLERSVMGRWVYAMATGKTQEGLNALDSLPETWVSDYDFVGPKALLSAALLELQGSTDLARLRCADAYAEVKRREALTPGDYDLVSNEIWSLHGLGRDVEARVLLRALNESIARPYRYGFGNSWWFSPLPGNLIMGEHATAVQFIREASARGGFGNGTIVLTKSSGVARNGYPNSYRQVIYRSMQVDPRMAPWRHDPEILAILAPPAAK